MFRAALDVMNAAKLPVYVIQGQHDRATPPWPSAVYGNDVQYVHLKEFQPITNGPVFYGIDQCPVAEQLKDMLNNVPQRVTGLVMHQLARAVFPMEGAWDFDTAWLPKQVKHLYIGDYHEPVSFKWDTNEAFYSGSTYMCSISEPVDKSFLHVTQGHNTLITKRIPLATRRCYTVVINDATDLERAVDHAAVAKQSADREVKPIVLIKYLVTVPEVVNKLSAAWGDTVYIWPQPVSNRVDWTRTGAANETELSHVGMEQCVGAFLTEGSDAHTMTLELLAAPDSEEVLEKWRVKKNVKTA